MSLGDIGKVFLVGVGVILLIAALIGMWGTGTYNGLVTDREGVKTQWGNVEASYQRRFDLIPNLVATVKGYATHEKSIWDEFAAARASYNSAQTPQAKIEASNQLEATLSKLMVVVEQYPELKANENFLSLQSQLEGTENRINVERQRYNEIARNYNARKKTFPTSIIAGFGSFEDFSYFEAQQTAQNAPKVDFGAGTALPQPTQ